MDWATWEPLAAQWRQEGAEYAAVASAYLRGELPQTPRDPRVPLAGQVLDLVRRANAEGVVGELRARFPPPVGPLGDLHPDHEIRVHSLLLLDERRQLVGVGGRGMFLIEGDRTTEIAGIITYGRSPDQRRFARAHPGGVDLCEGWDAPARRILPWPSGREGIPAGVAVEGWEGPPPIVDLLPFPDGERALLVSERGIFVLGAEGAERIHPDQQALLEWIAEWEERHPGRPVPLALSMAHGAISPGGDLLAVGDQDSDHRLLGRDLRQVATVAPLTSYPHHAVFSADGAQVALNSCHLYQGGTLGIPVGLLPELAPDAGPEDDRLNVLDDTSRIYAAVAFADGYVFGDA